MFLLAWKPLETFHAMPCFVKSKVEIDKIVGEICILQSTLFFFLLIMNKQPSMTVIHLAVDLSDLHIRKEDVVSTFRCQLIQSD